jgi:hypothetical protein
VQYDFSGLYRHFYLLLCHFYPLLCHFLPLLDDFSLLLNFFSACTVIFSRAAAKTSGSNVKQNRFASFTYRLLAALCQIYLWPECVDNVFPAMYRFPLLASLDLLLRYETVHSLSKEDFKRSTGVQRSTFNTMRQVIEQELGQFRQAAEIKPG